MEATYSEKVHQRISAVSKNVRQHPKLYTRKGAKRAELAILSFLEGTFDRLPLIPMMMTSHD